MSDYIGKVEKIKVGPPPSPKGVVVQILAGGIYVPGCKNPAGFVPSSDALVKKFFLSFKILTNIDIFRILTHLFLGVGVN